MGSLKLIVLAGVVVTVGLLCVGKFVNSEGEKLRDDAREARQERREMFDMAMQQSRAAQNLVRMQMERRMAEFEDYENFEDFERFAQMQYLQAQQYNQNH